MTTTDNKIINKNYIAEEAKKITSDDLIKVKNSEKEIVDTFTTKGLFGRYVEDAKLMIAVIKDYQTNAYKAIPWFTISAIIFALLYIINPLDIIPDFIPFIGYVDDLAIFVFCFELVEKDLKKYKKWKLGN